MELQAPFIPSVSRYAIPCQPGKRGRKVEKLQTAFSTVALILYGSMDMLSQLVIFHLNARNISNLRCVVIVTFPVVTLKASQRVNRIRR